MRADKNPKRPKSVIIFTTPSCGVCTRAKSYFKLKEIAFKSIDLSTNPQAQQDCRRHGCKESPVILIGGTRWVCGFDEKKIEMILKS
ncbi:MAG: glutaredoxin family protein [Epsilonproteobacteria bacterium]|nr:glutaredoxin family protein [Campylobacterota bacterium]